MKMQFMLLDINNMQLYALIEIFALNNLCSSYFFRRYELLNIIFLFFFLLKLEVLDKNVASCL